MQHNMHTHFMLMQHVLLPVL